MVSGRPHPSSGPDWDQAGESRGEGCTGSWLAGPTPDQVRVGVLIIGGAG